MCVYIYIYIYICIHIHNKDTVLAFLRNMFRLSRNVWFDIICVFCCLRMGTPEHYCLNGILGIPTTAGADVRTYVM